MKSTDMKNIALRFSGIAWITALLLVLPHPLTTPAEAGGDDHHQDVPADAETALCNVCRVHDGETEPEPVLASVDFQGETYGFCSEDCRDTFLKAPEAYVPPVFPRPAPAFEVRDLDGASVASEDLAGRVTLLDFWATWCPPCIKDLPALSALHRRYAESGFSVVGVSIDEGKDAARKVAKMVKKREASHPIYLDSIDAPAWGAFDVRVVPTQYLIDAEGQIVAQWSGKIDLAIVEAAIARLLDGGEGPSS